MRCYQGAGLGESEDNQRYTQIERLVPTSVPFGNRCAQRSLANGDGDGIVARFKTGGTNDLCLIQLRYIESLITTYC